MEDGGGVISIKYLDAIFMMQLIKISINGDLVGPEFIVLFIILCAAVVMEGFPTG